MSEQLITWIRRVATLNDSDLEEELNLINKNSLNVFARVISHTHHPELDFHTEMERMKHIHMQIQSIYWFLLEYTLSAINSETPVSSHMDDNTRIKEVYHHIGKVKMKLKQANSLSAFIPL
ncbi:hypothetical protein BDEG_24598 [Batrachochytrium dendrobatidis JEL423]|uniref:Uncharacterized protein n=1 Tax=Batrachochytrium dendrobatidis (strain JEL423) TaxID=403673 RepID=A0A177WMK2_BATDL|nr:hypothetical protein BDEG_24598 [Batrachochytrium dendrobatidis JEL423]